MVSIEQIKEFRDETGVSIAICKEVLEAAGGNKERAKQLLRERGEEIVEKRAARETRDGIIAAYIHSNAKIGSLVELKCETDFVSRNEDFRKLAHDIAMQVAAADPNELANDDIESLLKQPYIKDPAITVGERIQEAVAKLKENIQLIRFTRYYI